MNATELASALPSRHIGGHTATALTQGWQLARSAPAACADPAQIPAAALQWMPAVVPGTVAMSLGADLDTVGRYDVDDWWYRCSFKATRPAGTQQRLRFEGMATLAEVWLNGQLILTSRNMFVAHVVDVTELLQADNELSICLRSLDRELAARKPRPRWKTALVDQQNLRWVRTSLLGRIPGWTPPIHPVGPWKPVVLETVAAVDLRALDLQAVAEGECGRIRLNAQLRVLGASQLSEARLRMGDDPFPLTLTLGQEVTVNGDLSLPQVPLWSPHTHGTPTLLPCSLELKVDGRWLSIDCGRIGFRTLQLERGAGQVQLKVNGLPVFCRGACWTTDDFIALHGDLAQLRRTLELARDGGLNMLRIGGTMTYESDAFYALCDELGILVWQDFMFANMDYPVGDEAFRAEIDAEAGQQLRRLQRHACIAVYCGGSEVEQQAAMLGLPESEWSNEFFRTGLPALCERWHAGVPYFRSSPCEGALPFHVAEGIAHYYGVGAYKRPISDVKSAGVKFTTECLGFSNVPEPETMELLLDGAVPPPHHPRWKARQPRDSGAGWDFEDIRDHYLQQLFGVDPIALRSSDVARYYALSRAVTGEVLQRVYGEWRAPANPCNGGLVWFFKDLWPGAGWGVVDSTGRAKAVYWYLKRAWASRTVHITDQGLDGLHLHVHNEQPEALSATVELVLYQHGRIRTAAGEQAVQVAGRSALTLQGDALLAHFFDTTYAYRFGPPQHDVTVARLKAADGTVLAEDFHFPQGLNLPMQSPTQWTAKAARAGDGSVLLDLSCDTFLQSVFFECEGYAPSDAHFHLAPQAPRQIVFRPLDAVPRKFKAYVGALNLREMLTVRAD
ncbi:MAG: glycoside hydrolase family 2 protein [Rhizobacter sp.]